MAQNPPLPKGAIYADDPPLPRGATYMDETKPSAPAATMSAASPSSWVDDLEQDMRQGGSRTFLGRTMGRLQGRGDKGYSGLESGVSKGAAEELGSPILGPIKMAQGARILPDHPISGTGKILSGALQTASLPMAFMGGPTANAAIEAIPTRANAGRLFERVMSAAENEPVFIDKSWQPLERTQQLAERGATPVRAADQLFTRINHPNELTYREARDFASNLSGLSEAEKMAANPTMHKTVGELSKAFNSDIGDAALRAGVGPEYSQAMREYAQAMGIRSGLIKAGKYGIGAAGLGIGGKYLKSKLPTR